MPEEYISREVMRDWIYQNQELINEYDLDNFPTADVVSKEVFNQVLWERDIALSQLAEIDKGLGAKMDDVEKIKYGRWTLNADGSATCSECGRRQLNAWDMDGWDNFCHHCGADMRWGGVNV